MSFLAIFPFLNAYAFVDVKSKLSCLCKHAPVRLFYLEKKRGKLIEMRRFYRVGGGNRIAGFLLAVATAGLLVVGAGPIAFLREFHCFPIFPP